jgi:flagellar basal-body rod protein FlgB
MLNLFGGTISSLENGLSYSTLKNKAIANNIANVDTPNYKAQEVSFKQYLADAQQKTGIEANRNDVRHYEFTIEQSTPGVYKYDNFRARHNGNGVNMDAEQVSLADNQIYYNALIDRISGKFSTLNNVVKGGR